MLTIVKNIFKGCSKYIFKRIEIKIFKNYYDSNTFPEMYLNYLYILMLHVFLINNVDELVYKLMVFDYLFLNTIWE